MIAVLIPAHNEQALIGACLDAIDVAASDPALHGEEVRVIVALDRCSDGTAAICARRGVLTVPVDGGNVGAARAVAAELALRDGARWLACTDADTLVPPHWLSAQLACDADAFCGVVTVDDWSEYASGMDAAFAGPHSIVDGHPHVHGANMGVSAAAYRRCGGFAALACSEDVALIDALVRDGARIARRARPAVRTSPRRDPRASGGFGDYLKALERSLLGAGMPQPV